MTDIARFQTDLLLCPSVPEEDLTRILERCSDLWPEFKGRRLLITGGTGFFGTWILETLAAANRQLQLDLKATIVSRNPEAFGRRFPHLWRDPAFGWIAGTAADFPFPPARHDYLLHLATATSAHLDRIAPMEMLSTKLASIRHVLAFARSSDTSRVLVTSSGAIYGRQPSSMSHIPETYLGAPDPMQENSAYGNGKRLVEQVCALHRDIDIVIGRCFSFMGPHLPLDARFAAGNFIRDALRGGPITISGDGTAIRSYLYAGDLVVWLLSLLLKGTAKTAYNVGSDNEISIESLARAVSVAAGGVSVELMESPGSEKPQRYVPAIDRARQELGLDAWTPLHRAIRQTFICLGTGARKSCP